MKRKVVALLAALALALAAVGLHAAPAQAANLPTIEVDVAAKNGTYDGYTIDDEKICLLRTGVVYSLSGNTERQVLAANAGADNQEDQFFYLRLNNAMVVGGIAAQDGDTFRLSINVPAGTTNNVETLRALALYVYGGGRLNAESLDVGPTSPNAPTTDEAYIKVADAQVEVQRDASATKSCVWMGDAELCGNASVTYVSAGDYAALRVLNKGDHDVAVTIKDNARLYCLQEEADEPSDTFVDGLQVVAGKLLLQDSAFLQAEGRPWSGGIEGEGGFGVSGGGDVEVTGSARIVADGYGSAIDVSGMTVSGKGAYVQACSKNAGAIVLGEKLVVSDGARVDATGRGNGIYADGAVSVDGAALVAESQTACAVKSETVITLDDATVQASSAPDCDVLSGANGVVIEHSLVAVEKGGFDAFITDSVVFVDNEGLVVGDATLLGDIAVQPGQILTVPEGASLTIPEGVGLVVEKGAKLINNGTIHVLGALGGEGDVECNGHSGGAATCAARAVCEVCHAEYGELDPHNHATGLVHVDAVAATTDSEGNIEYWCCPDCHRCFSDEAGTVEVTKASLVTPKLDGEKGAKAGKKPAADEKPKAKKVPKTGDPLSALPVAAALLGGCALLACARGSKQR